MKFIGLIILVFLLALLQTTTKAQTASNTPVTKYYSSQLKELLAAGVHPAPANPSQALPSENEIPKKARDLANDGKQHDRNPNGKLPGEASVDRNEMKTKNDKWLHKKAE
jgi:hypothetical protein